MKRKAEAGAHRRGTETAPASGFVDRMMEEWARPLGLMLDDTMRGALRVTIGRLRIAGAGRCFIAAGRLGQFGANLAVRLRCPDLEIAADLVAADEGAAPAA